MDLFDTYTMDGIRRTNDGYLTAFARVARTGVQEYRGHELGRPDLDKVRLYRPTEEVFNADAMRSFAHRPVTHKHPPVPVTAKNWKKYAGGHTGDDVVRDGEYVRVPLILSDQQLIDAYEKDGIKELSFGYSTDIKWVTGITDAGEPYDAVQTAIRGNHLAVVPVARGGDMLRIGDEGIEDDPNNGEYPMRMVIDGMPVNVADDQSGAIIEKHIAKLQSISDSFDFFKKKKEEDDAEAEKKKKVADALTGEVAVLKQQLADATITPEKLDALVKTRSECIDKAKGLVDSKYVFDGKTLETIRRDAVTAKLGAAAKDMNDGAIEGAFAYATLGGKSGAVSQIGDAIRNRPHSAPMITDARDQAYEEMVKRNENAWKGTASA